MSLQFSQLDDGHGLQLIPPGGWAVTDPAGNRVY
jgi:hypothetical protein